MFTGWSTSRAHQNPMLCHTIFRMKSAIWEYIHIYSQFLGIPKWRKSFLFLWLNIVQSGDTHHCAVCFPSHSLMLRQLSCCKRTACVALWPLDYTIWDDVGTINLPVIVQYKRQVKSNIHVPILTHVLRKMVLVCFMWLPVTINVRSSIYKIAYHNVSQILAHHSSSNLSGQPLASNSSRSRARTSARQSGYFWGSSMETPLGNAEWLPQLLLLDISFACGDWRDWLTSSHLLVFHVFLCSLQWFKYFNAFNMV